MSVSLPEKIVSELGMFPTYEEWEDVMVHLESGQIELPGWCSPSDVVAALRLPPFAEVAFKQCQPSGAWRFTELSIATVPECHLLEVGAWTETAVPTIAAQALVRAWLSAESFDSLESVKDHSLGLLVCWLADTSFRSVSSDFALAVSGWKVLEGHDSPALRACAATQVEIANSSLFLREKEIYATLLQAASRSSSPPLRFLYLYRLFERAYLIGALDKLKDNFFLDPKRALDETQSAVSSESKAFVSLVSGSEAQANFSSIYSLFAKNKASLSNRFLSAILHAAEKNGDKAHRDDWIKGCLLAYRVRCSIVHAGKIGPIYESFSDAPDACELLNPHMEQAVLTFFGWSVA